MDSEERIRALEAKLAEVTRERDALWNRLEEIRGLWRERQRRYAKSRGPLSEEERAKNRAYAKSHYEKKRNRLRESLKPRVTEVWQHYQTYHPRAKWGEVYARKIRGRLKEGWSVDELKLAIDGQHQSPFHRGDNASGKKYLSLELAMRSSDKVQQFIDVGQQGNVSAREAMKRRILGKEM